MTIPAFWNETWTAALVNHLWQSTALVGVAWLLATALRKNHARVRYWIWLAASVKFLLPFSLLIVAGEWLRSLVPAPPVAHPAVESAIEQVAQPFAQAQLFGATDVPVAVHHAALLPVVLLSIWACGALLVAARFTRGWRRVYSTKLAAFPIGTIRAGRIEPDDPPAPALVTAIASRGNACTLKAVNLPTGARVLPFRDNSRARNFSEHAAEVPVLSCPDRLEPGIFGIFQPALLLPEGMLQRLPSEQLQAIVAHEICHVRRRDNLTCAIHMIVEVLFWFHPAVWWIGARLIEERERACDEAVVQAGGESQVYAEGILNVCKFYVESPVACVAGVTGADLKKRIARIMAERVARRLSLSRMLLLGTAVALTLAVPVVLGVVRAEASQAENAAAEFKNLKFEVVSIRPNKHGGQQIFGKTTPDGWQMQNMFMMAPIVTAYSPSTGGAAFAGRFQGETPAWLTSDEDRYDIDAKVDEADLPDWQNPSKRPTMLRAMLQNMLADRLKLKIHRSTKEEQVYALVVAKGGPHFKESVPGETHPGAFPAPGGE